MRIIAGEYKGRVLRAPKSNTTRPTTDRVREALMSSLISSRGDFHGARVLDAFAGSGALGLEALSRGAISVVFFERDASTCRVLKANIASLGINDSQSIVYQKDALKHTAILEGESFDIVFLDPPYATSAEDICTYINRLSELGAVGDQTLIVYEHAKKNDSVIQQLVKSLQWMLVSHKSYGDISIEIFGL